MSNIDDTMSVSPHTSFPFSEERKENALKGIIGKIMKVYESVRKQITTNSTTTDEGCTSSAKNTENTSPNLTDPRDLSEYPLDPDELVTAFSCNAPPKAVRDAKKKSSNAELYGYYVDLTRL